MEASALQAPTTLAQPRVSIGLPILRFRSDEQLLTLFRAGNDDAFRAIHDRYRGRLFAYARQMLPGRQDAEDALQDVFVRAYAGLRSSDRELALRAWLFRVAHNRCIDELRRPLPPAPEVLQLVRSNAHDPVAEADLRESVRRLIADIRRLPEQQRSALLMRELAGMSYADLSTSLDVSVPAVKSLLVRARIALAQAAEARDTACSAIRAELVGAHDRGVRPNANARKHMHDCIGCKSFRRELRGVSRRMAALTPAVGPLGIIAKVLGLSGFSGGGATAGGATAGGGAAVVGGSGAMASAGGLVLGANHVATLLVAAVATAGGAVEIQHTLVPVRHAAHVRSATERPAYGGRPSRPPLTVGSPVTAAQLQAVQTEAEVQATVAKAPPTTGSGTAEARLSQKARLRADRPSGTAGGAGMSPAANTQGAASPATTADGQAVTPILAAGQTGSTTTTGGSATTNTSSSSTGSGSAGSGGGTGTGSTTTQSTNEPNSTGSGTGTATTGSGSSTSSTGSGSTTTSNGTSSGTSSSGTSSSSPSSSSSGSSSSAPI